MNDLRDFFKLLRYLLIFLVVVMGMAIFSKHADAAQCPSDPIAGWNPTLHNSIECPEGFERCNLSVTMDGYSGICGTRSSIPYVRKNYFVNPPAGKTYQVISETFENKSGVNYSSVKYGLTAEKPQEPCETPKTDEQCKKGQRRQVTLPKSFWSQSTAEHKGCVISVESPGVGIANMGDDRATGHVNMMGSTGKSWCANTGTSDTTAQSIGASGEFTPTTTPKDCPKGSVTMGGQSWCYTGASDGVTKPDGSVPDDGIHDNGTSDDGSGGDVDSSIDREPGDGSGGGDTGGGGGGSGGGTGEGDGISKGDIKDGVKEGVEEALGKGSGAPAPIVLPTVDDVEGGINGVMGRYKQRINNAPISNAFNSISFSVPSAGCSPWGIHLDYLDVSLQFDQCTFLNTHSGMIGAIMMAMFAGLSVVVFLKA